MGIKDLITKKIKDLFETAMMESFSDSIVAVDVSIYMCRSKSVGGGDGKIMRYFRAMVKRFETLNIFPIFVFDGEKSPLKGMTSDKRKTETSRKKKIVELIEKGPIKDKEEKQKLIMDLRESGNRKAEYLSSETDDRLFAAQIAAIRDTYIKELDTMPTDEETDELYYYLQLMGYRPIIINGHESESFCAYLNKHGYVDFVLSEDSDCFVWGAEQIVTGYTNAYGKPVCLRRKEILMNALGFTNHEQLINYGILLGTDYNARAYGNGPGRALKIVHGSRDYGRSECALYTGKELYGKIVDDINHDYRNELTAYCVEMTGKEDLDALLKLTISDLYAAQKREQILHHAELVEKYLNYL